MVSRSHSGGVAGAVDKTVESNGRGRAQQRSGAHWGSRGSTSRQDKTAWDRWQGFTRRLFLGAAVTSGGVPSELTETLWEVLECKTSGLAIKILWSKAGLEGWGFWVQPDLINSLRNGLIVAEALNNPEGLTPFLTPGCPDGLTFHSFDD